MTDGEIVAVQKKSLAKGLLAGLIGGLAATGAKSLVEKVYPPRAQEPEPPEVFAEKIAGREFGAAAGAAYGALVEYFPAASDKEGASFGMALATLTHEGALPAIGLAAPEEQTAREHTSEIATHLVFGVVTETVRRYVRRLL
jgi:putative membrane protein